MEEYQNLKTELVLVKDEPVLTDSMDNDIEASCNIQNNIRKNYEERNVIYLQSPNSSMFSKEGLVIKPENTDPIKSNSELLDEKTVVEKDNNIEGDCKIDDNIPLNYEGHVVYPEDPNSSVNFEESVVIKLENPDPIDNNSELLDDTTAEEQMNIREDKILDLLGDDSDDSSFQTESDVDDDSDFEESDSSSSCSFGEYNWKLHGLAKNYPQQFPFTGNPGINVQITDNRPLGLFELFITDDLVESIVEETNRYAQQQLENRPLQQYSKLQKWTDTNSGEMRTFFAFWILEGIIWKPEHEFYFTSKPVFITPGFRKLLSLTRFRLLTKFLHFVDNSAEGIGNKKLRKIEPITDYVFSRFSEIYTPERDVCIDESLVLWKGSLSFKQYLGMKRARFGIKSYIISEGCSGYIWNIIVYCGRGSNVTTYKNLGHASNVVLSLAEPLLDKGYCIFCDNFYCSPELANALVSRDTDIVGTVRKNRKNLSLEVLRTKLQRGEMTAAYEENKKLMLMKWMDKREVLYLSTKHTLECVAAVRRGKNVVIPSLVDEYNKKMDGADKVDQMLSAYPTERKRSKIWYKKQFRHILNMCIFNAHALHIKLGGKMTSLQFRQSLVEESIEKYFVDSPMKKGRRSITDPLRLKERHFPSLVTSKNTKSPVRRCAVCSSKKKRQSRYQCDDCDVGLCVVPCFRDFHTKKVF